MSDKIREAAMTPNVFEYEEHMIPVENWFSCGAPEEAIAILKEEDGGGPIGLSKHPKHGWAVLACGQGPFIVWAENKAYENG